jgi:hypothetical protein
MEQFHTRLKAGSTPTVAWQATAVNAIRQNQSTEWMAYAVMLGRGSLDGSPRQMTDDMSGGR